MLALSRLDFVVRVSAVISNAAAQFVATGADDGFVEVQPTGNSAAKDAGPQRLRVVVTRRIARAPMALLTTPSRSDFSTDEIRAIYRLRWEIEE